MLIMVITFLMISGGIAQYIEADRVSDAVRSEFIKQFPKATNQVWTLEGSTYQVMFAQGETKFAMKFDNDGNWLDKETRILKSALPKAVSKAIARHFPGFTIYEAEKVETPSKGMLYNVGIEKGNEIIEVHLSPKGDILGKVSKEKKSDWGKDDD